LFGIAVPLIDSALPFDTVPAPVFGACVALAVPVSATAPDPAPVFGA
jgi:hypothetical protein